MKTSIETLKQADWDRLESDVLTRIRLLKTAVAGMEPGPLNDKIAEDLFLPCLQLLGEFCGAFDITEQDDQDAPSNGRPVAPR